MLTICFCLNCNICKLFMSCALLPVCFFLYIYFNLDVYFRFLSLNISFVSFAPLLLTHSRETMSNFLDVKHNGFVQSFRYSNQCNIIFFYILRWQDYCWTYAAMALFNKFVQCQSLNHTSATATKTNTVHPVKCYTTRTI